MGTTRIPDTRRDERQQQVHRPPLTLETIPHGLCVSCAHFVDCTFYRPRDTPVWSCDEFEAGLEDPVLTALRAAAAPGALTTSPDQTEPRRGLCTSCAHEASCTFYRPDTGVWSCVEYE